MSNLWKALRDVSRDVDPTVGFEPVSETPEPEVSKLSWAIAEASNSLPGPAAGRAAEPPATSSAFSLTPRRPRPQVGAAAVVAAEASDQPAPAEERIGPLQSPLRRKALTNALQFDKPGAPDQMVRPARFAADDLAPPPRAGAPWDPEPAPAVTEAPPVARLAEPDGEFRTPRATSAGTTARHPYGAGRPATTESSFSPPSSVAEPQPWVAPAMSLTPNWSPGDDDVMPSDGRRGAKRPKLRDRLPW